MDMDFETEREVSIESYIEMISLKTSVLLAASMKIGALIAGAPAADADCLYAFGKNLGIAFQLRDDYLDAFGASDKVGKQTGGDIIANKKTYLHIHAVTHADAQQLQQIRYWLEAGQDEAKVPAMLQLFQDTGADQHCRDAAAHYSEQAFASLASLNVPEEKKQYLYTLAKDLLYREQ
jgi:geranylgeranyl diphosphate synthase type II